MISITSKQVEQAFVSAFYNEYKTLLKGGFDEPFYRAATDQRPEAVIEYRSDYVASALHEVAHWCVAGPERRKLDDFGYWYTPDGRDEDIQRQFEVVEVRPQAYECLFTWSLKRPFRVSADNLALHDYDDRDFQARVIAEVGSILASEMPPRVARFCQHLWGLVSSPEHKLTNWLEQQYENFSR